jgi:hypothetical protein
MPGKAGAMRFLPSYIPYGNETVGSLFRPEKAPSSGRRRLPFLTGEGSLFRQEKGAFFGRHGGAPYQK